MGGLKKFVGKKFGGSKVFGGQKCLAIKFNASTLVALQPKVNGNFVMKMRVTLQSFCSDANRMKMLRGTLFCALG